MVWISRWRIFCGAFSRVTFNNLIVILIIFSNGELELDYPPHPQVAIQPFKIKRHPMSDHLNKIDFMIKLINKFI